MTRRGPFDSGLSSSITSAVNKGNLEDVCRYYAVGVNYDPFFVYIVVVVERPPWYLNSPYPVALSHRDFLLLIYPHHQLLTVINSALHKLFNDGNRLLKAVDPL